MALAVKLSWQHSYKSIF